MNTLTLALLIEEGGEPRLRDLQRESVEAAIAEIGDANRIELQVADDPGEYSSVVQEADWILVLSSAGLVLPDALKELQALAPAYDGIWGSSVIGGADNAQIEPDARGACHNLAQVMYRKPEAWLATGFFVRPGALAVSGGLEALNAGMIDSAIRLWGASRCIKTSAPLFLEGAPALAEDRRAEMQERLAAANVIQAIELHGRMFKFWISYTNPILEINMAAGQFFEFRHLNHVRELLPEGGVVIDIGANIGSHAVYFGAFLSPSRLVILEPDPAMIPVLRRNLELNDIEADTSLLGIAVSDTEEKFGRNSLAENPSDNALQVSPVGTIKGAPLDNLIDGAVDFVKIDVEGMELRVLDGMRRIMAEARPVIMIEVLNTLQDEFLERMTAHDYRVETAFPNPQYTDFVIVPSEWGNAG